MFGYITADTSALTPAQRLRYQGAYCGLCRTLHARYGQLSRLTLSYDMTFLILLLSSMYEPEETGGAGRCAPHPLHGRSWWRNRFTDYAADMSVALAYHKCLDDWADDKAPLALAESKLLRPHYAKAAARWPDQCRAMETCLARLHAVETAPTSGPDAAADCFGELMGALFSPEPDAVWQPRFRAFGAALGRFIYMMDACLDLDADRRRGRYNPLAALYPAGLPAAEQRALLTVLMGECTAEFEQLPLLRDTEILRSVLYSGVWTRCAQRQKQKKGGEGDGQ